MKIRDFVRQLGIPIFATAQAVRVVGEDEQKHLNIQLSRWIRSGQVERVKRGLYIVADQAIDELAIAHSIYPSSYVSMESALNLAGIMPDITAEVTSVVTGKPRKYQTRYGIFSYSKVQKDLYFGYTPQITGKLVYYLAVPEKALLDLIYVRRVRDLSEMRVDWGKLNKHLITNMVSKYPVWVRKEIKKYV